MKFSKNLLPTLACGSLAFGTVQAQDGETSPTAEVAAEEAPQESMKIEVPSDVKAPPADAEKTASGLASKVLQKGTGTEKPSSTDTVTVHYSGWTTDGEMFDSSVERGSTTSFLTLSFSRSRLLLSHRKIRKRALAELPTRLLKKAKAISQALMTS